MKMYSKIDCIYRNGYIVSGDEIVPIDNEIVDLLNKLEEDVQRKEFEDGTCGEMPCYKAPGEFVRRTERGKIMPHVEANTPQLDAMVDRTMAMMEEFDAIADAGKVNEYFASIIPVIEFVNDDFIVPSEHGVQHRFDLPTIGNPLDLDRDKLSELVIGLF